MSERTPSSQRKGSKKRKSKFPKHLNVRVIEAKDLIRECDPYCILAVLQKNEYEEKDFKSKDRMLKDPIRGERFKTLPINHTKTPLWQPETYIFQVDENAEELIVELWNKCFTKNDDFLGEVRVPLESLKKQNGVDAWYDIQKRRKEDEVSGQLHLLLSLVPDNKKHTKRQVKKKEYSHSKMEKLEDLASEKELQALNEKEVHRQRVIFELIMTEQAYVSDLELISLLFIDGMFDRALLSKSEISFLFANIKQLFKDVHTHLLKDLLESQASQKLLVTGIGEIFLNHIPMLNLYTQYCQSYLGAINRMTEIRDISKAVNGYLEECFTLKECRELPIGAFLIKPNQRMCKYPLLFREILKYTPEEHADYAKCLEASEKLNKILQAINEHANKALRVSAMMNFQAKLTNKEEEYDYMKDKRRYIIKEGDVVVASMKKTHSGHHLVLFNDKLVVCKKSVEKKKEDAKVSYKVLWDGWVKDTVHEDPALQTAPQTEEDTPREKRAQEEEQQRSFFLRNGGQSFKIMAPSVQEKREWISMLDDALSNTERDSSERSHIDLSVTNVDEAGSRDSSEGTRRNSGSILDSLTSGKRAKKPPSSPITPRAGLLSFLDIDPGRRRGEEPSKGSAISSRERSRSATFTGDLSDGSSMVKELKDMLAEQKKENEALKKEMEDLKKSLADANEELAQYKSKEGSDTATSAPSAKGKVKEKSKSDLKRASLVEKKGDQSPRAPLERAARLARYNTRDMLIRSCSTIEELEDQNQNLKDLIHQAVALLTGAEEPPSPQQN